MAKFYGQIGFTVMTEIDTDIWDAVETERFYTGDLVRNQRRWESNDHVNEDLTVSNEISIMADDFIRKNAGAIKWVEIMGSKWKVNSINIDYPRVVLTVGGVYNGG